MTSTASVTPDASSPPPPRGKKLALLCLTSLGIVYGDISTSPIYAIRECFHGDYGITPDRANVLGVLSLVFWCLILIVTVKYLSFVLRADNNGEGGVIALMALLSSKRSRSIGTTATLIAVGLFGASLLYGDGMITPAISVLSAIEGLEVATPVLSPYVVPITVAILLLLFSVQHRGTARIGGFFGPITLLWLVVLACLGLRSIVSHPGVIAAVNPTHGVTFFVNHGIHGYLVLGAVFLVVTGTEALYADMGHFGRRPIRITWLAIVLPALLLNYFGQGALILEDPATATHPFYALAPSWALYPVVALATAATIIASQAVISGSFSLTRQAIQLGYCPRLRIRHTASDAQGQIYVPAINWILMVASIALVIGFRSSGRLAAAYGLAVTTTMTITSLLLYAVARNLWGWSRVKAGIPTVLFLIIDLSFFGGNILKIAHGAWFPLLIGLAAFTLLSTWKKGRDLVANRIYRKAARMEDWIPEVCGQKPQRVPGRAVFMTSNPEVVPPALLLNFDHNKVLHEEVVILSILTEDRPYVPKGSHISVESLGFGFHRVTARYGFMEEPTVPRILATAKSKGLELSMADTSFFLGRESLLAKPDVGLPYWRGRIFAFLSRNALGATAFFRIPPDQVIEIGRQVEV